LAKKLDVNRATLREALKKLEHLGLVRIRQGDGTRVQNYIETGGIELVPYLAPLASSGHSDLIRDMLEFRRLFGREVARMAAERAAPEHIAHLREIAARASNPDLSAAELFEVDFDFYVAMTAGTQNTVMRLLVNTVRTGVRSYTPLLVPLTSPSEIVRTHHEELLAAIEARDPDAAARIANDYLQRGADIVIQLLGSAAARTPADGAAEASAAATPELATP
jgi:GntR family transcriptional repressor for pyruvate dehydrogenase complex